MATPINEIFVDFSVRKLEQMNGRIRECVDQLSEEQIWQRGTETENAAGNLLLHLSGNVRQWIVSGVGGKPDVRVRDREFSARGDIAKSDLLERLGGVVDDALAVMKKLTAERLSQTVTIQGYQMTVMEAVYHVVEHFALHTGQIILLTKMFTRKDLGFYRHLGQAPHQEKTP
jgi:uncharacterized damage-inducible protein DinB